jgi:hypothetical protein
MGSPLKLISGTILLLLIALFPSQSTAQERISIEDPELTFSYTRPLGWISADEDFYHYVRKPDKNTPAKPVAEVIITYYDGRCQDLDECFDGEVNGNLANTYPAFTKISSGEESIDGTRAKWQKFSSQKSGESIPTIRYAYYFINHAQFFVIEISFKSPLDEKEALAIIRSFSTKRS